MRISRKVTELQRAIAVGSAAVAVSVWALAAAPASACSVCRCGDPTFNALGTQIFDRGKLRIAVDWERLEQSQGSSEGAGESESLTESRSVVTVSYAPLERLQLVGRIPWSHRDLVGDGERTVTDGLGDPELYGLVRLWSGPWVTGMGRRSWVSLVAGVKTSWGRNDLERGGERLDEHAQPGTGATAPFAGLSAVHLLDPKTTIYGSASARQPARNSFGYRYGSAFLANFGFERKLSKRFDAAVELNYRDAAKDETDRSGARDPDTGGRLFEVTPRLLVSLGHGLVGRVAVRIPAVKDLNGVQDEKKTVNLGLTYSF